MFSDVFKFSILDLHFFKLIACYLCVMLGYFVLLLLLAVAVMLYRTITIMCFGFSFYVCLSLCLWLSFSLFFHQYSFFNILSHLFTNQIKYINPIIKISN